MFAEYDVIVVGAGHAGCEAAAAAANMGSKVLLITMNMQTIAQMSCNPAMGGIAKGQIVDFYQDMVRELILKNGKACGVVTQLGHTIAAKAVVVTSGTFLNGVIHIGEKQFGGGRVAEKVATGITEQLVAQGMEASRLKTGTPPRVDGRSLDYSKMEEQQGDTEITGFSYLPNTVPITAAQQRSCYITYTNTTVHDILKTGFDRSPMFQGRIEGVGPRYCPSIEDKINRFAERDRHQLFVEPEGWNTVEIYVNGFSTSLPEEVQIQALQQVPGFENCKIFRPGYAIEYDFFPPTQLTHALETKAIQNLFFAGQINGTTGYEEAACQGIMAGMNAHLKINGQAPFILKRSEAYIGVLIDDLISKGTEEPYRMFTSRAEYRTLLRQDNADLRLTEISYRLGLASQERMEGVRKKQAAVAAITEQLQQYAIEPDAISEYLNSIQSAPLSEKQKAAKLLLRPSVTLTDMLPHLTDLQQGLQHHLPEYLEQAEIQIKYERYIAKEQELVEKMNVMEDLLIPENFDYDRLQALSSEARQ
jgi:tRNA uridine 5-carboxymethylaminomethyl modification enzyme